MNQPIFALDIGTQSVAGILLKKSNNTYTVLDYYIEQHKERAMLDGQIHDVLKVAKIIKNVKEQLETKHGKLNSVKVAAAGRSLKTILGKARIPLNRQPITDSETIRYLELTAVQNAQKELTDKLKEDQQEYYCVGYSVVHYKIDDQVIGSLIDQVANEATVEVIASFLPQVVIESLLASLKRAGLTMKGLTLEPIAAIEILIPDSMRRLNLALVDIGAGTSDIAITRDGTVVAYGMVDQAGDEITEAISDHFLLDFDYAEKAKKEIVNKGMTSVTDILGFPKELSLADALEAMEEPVNRLSKALAHEILTLNKKAPQAIMLIGGGSLAPNIDKILAEKLQLPENRIAIRSLEAIESVENISILPQGPDFITPLGIAITATSKAIHYTTVVINEKTFRLFNVKPLTIGDCLLHAGISLKNIYGKPGPGYVIKWKGQNISIPGELGKPPIITKNNTPARITDPVEDGDELFFEKGTDGNEPYISLRKLADDIEPLTVSINQKLHTFPAKYIVNGIEVDEDYILKDKDEVIVELPKTIKDLLHLLEEEVLNISFPLYVDGNHIQMKKGRSSYQLNGKFVDLSARIKQNDQIIITKAKQPRVKDVLAQLKEESKKKISVTFNGEKVELEKEIINVYKNGNIISENTKLLPNDRLSLERRSSPFIFQDIFRFVEFNANQIEGHYKVLINEKEASFFDPINDGDQLEIK